MAHVDNLAEYADPDLYDLENDEFEPDGPFYLALAQRIGGRVLELGCGTGRITIPLAQAGIEITGIDIAPPMLEQAKRKVENLPVRWVEADVRDFALREKFNFIFESGATFQHMLDRSDQEAMFARVHEHLEPEGRFVVSSQFPISDIMASDETESDWFSYPTEQGYEVRVSGTQHYDALRQIKTETAYRRWHDAKGHEIVKIAPLMLRYVFPQEMEGLLHYNGFTILERYGDMDFSPITNESDHLIYVCQKKA